jgi:hypothetical protein
MLPRGTTNPHRLENCQSLTHQSLNAIINDRKETIINANLAAVESHFHNEATNEIEKDWEKLGVAPANALVIEDSVNGVRSGKAAGCPVTSITTSFPRERLMELQTDYVVDSFAELERLLGFE